MQKQIKWVTYITETMQLILKLPVLGSYDPSVFSYKKLEEEGVMLPVFEFSIKYFKPAFYDDLLIIKTTIPEPPGPE